MSFRIFLGMSFPKKNFLHDIYLNLSLRKFKTIIYIDYYHRFVYNIKPKKITYYKNIRINIFICSLRLQFAILTPTIFDLQQVYNENTL